MCYPLRLGIRKLGVNSNPQGSNKKFQADHFRTKSCLNFGDCLVGVWKVFGNCLEGARQVPDGYLEGFWKVSGYL